MGWATATPSIVRTPRCIATSRRVSAVTQAIRIALSRDQVADWESAGGQSRPGPGPAADHALGDSRLSARFQQPCRRWARSACYRSRRCPR
jgi:hypothetical protein